MINQRIAIPLDSNLPLEWASPPDPPLPVPVDSTFVRAKRCVESWIEQFPEASLGSAFCLGLCIGWLIKRR